MNSLTIGKATPLAMSTETISDSDRLTLEQRVTALETAFAKLALREHNNEFTRLGSPPQGVFAPALIASTSDEHTELRKLESELAYWMARLDIESFGEPETVPGGKWCGQWYGRIAPTADECLCEKFDRAVRYLDLLNLIERHPTAAWLRVKELP